MDDPIYRAGAWWLRRDDGRWLYWNIRGAASAGPQDARGAGSAGPQSQHGRWDHHPYGPPAVAPLPGGSVGTPPQPPPPPPMPHQATMAAHTSWQPPGPAPYPQPYPPPYPAPYAQVWTPRPKPAPAWASGSPVVFADWWRRMLAFIVDQLVVWLPTALILVIVSAAAGPGTVDPFTGDIDTSSRNVLLLVTAITCYFVLIPAYFAFSHGGESGATLGKRLLNIRVADLQDGSRVGVGRAFLRWTVAGLFWTFLYIPGILNLLWPLWDPQRQAWHDKIANSVVVTAPR
jgi:uncharacterized RDD family membrane protein YckC